MKHGTPLLPLTTEKLAKEVAKEMAGEMPA